MGAGSNRNTLLVGISQNIPFINVQIDAGCPQHTVYTCVDRQATCNCVKMNLQVGERILERAEKLKGLLWKVMGKTIGFMLHIIGVIGNEFCFENNCDPGSKPKVCCLQSFPCKYVKLLLLLIILSNSCILVAKFSNR